MLTDFFNFYYLLAIVCGIVFLSFYVLVIKPLRRRRKIWVQTWNYDGSIDEGYKRFDENKVKFSKEWEGTFNPNDVKVFRRKNLGRTIEKKGLAFIDGSARPIRFTSKDLELSRFTRKEAKEFVNKEIIKARSQDKAFSRTEFYVLVAMSLIIIVLLFRSMRII